MKICLFILIFMLSAFNLPAQETPVRSPQTIRANGEAVVMMKPDRAQIDIGVFTQAPTAQVTVERNSFELEKVISELKKLLGANADIKTINYALTPTYRYAQPPTEPIPTGFTATNIVRVVIDDLGQLGKVIETGSSAGANRIQGLQFMIKNQRDVQAQALAEAAINARNKARIMASAMGLTPRRILSLSETTPPVMPYPQYINYSAFSGGMASTPIAPRTIEVRAMVALVVEIAPQP